MSVNNSPLSGRAALVTGVSRSTGIGYATARRLGRLGASLFLHAWTPHDRVQSWAKGMNIEGVESLAQQLRSEGLTVEYVEADFSDPQAPSEVMGAAVGAYGHVDILIANHAYSSWQSLSDLTVDELDRHLAVNVRGTLMLAQALGAQHDGRPGGRVIMMTSGQANGSMEREVAYAVSKGALHQITQTLSASLIPKGITVNTINPGPTDTGWPSEAESQFVAQYMPLGRWGEPDDAARLIAWLCTDDAQWITGQVINSTGGFRSRFRQADIPEG